MEIRISDMLDNIQDDTVQINNLGIVSCDKIKETTMSKLHSRAYNTNVGNNVITSPRRLPRFTAIAAIICLMVALSISAYAVYQYSLRDLILPNNSSAPISDSTDTTTVSEAERPYFPAQENTLISLQGYAGSPEYMAMAEWNEFVEGYDLDGTLLHEADAVQKEQLETTGTMAIPGLEEHYWMYYGAYTREMADKLDEIATKYGLKLHTERTGFESQERLEALAYDTLGGEHNTFYYGYMYENGTFKLEGAIGNEDDYPVVNMVEYDPEQFSSPEAAAAFIESDPNFAQILENHPGEWVYTPVEGWGNISITGHTDQIGFSFLYCKTGTLTYVLGTIGDISDYNEWTYDTASGVTVILCQSTYESLILVELEEAFITVNIMEGSDGFAPSELETFADTLDFTIRK